MTSFWTSELGPLSGSVEDAFAKSFRQIPDNTLALAKIVSFTNKSYEQTKYLQIEWLLTDGQFKGQHVFQKLHVFDADNKKRHRFLNMLMLVYKMFQLTPKSSEPPTDDDLKAFVNKFAGIKIQETEPNDKGRQYNWVSEIHPAAGFKCETGESAVHATHYPESALTRNAASRSNVALPDLTDEIPF